MPLLQYTLKNVPIGGYCMPHTTSDTQFTCKPVQPGDCVIAECAALEKGLFIAGTYVPSRGVLRMQLGNCSGDIIQPAKHDWRFTILR